MQKIKAIIKNPNVIWNMIGITLNSFYSLILMIFVTRINTNGVEAAGQFSFAFYIVSLFSAIGAYGGRIFHVSDTKGEFHDSHYISLKYVTSVVMVIMTILFCLINGYDLVKFSLIVVLVLYRVFESVGDAYYGVLQKNDDLKTVGKSMTMKALGSTILFILLDIVTQNLVLSSISFLIVFILVTYGYDRVKANRYGKIEIKIDQKVLRLLKECFSIFSFAFLTLLIMNTTRYIVDLKLNDTMQGYFGILIMPASIIALFAQFLVQPMIKQLVDLYASHDIMKVKKNMAMLLCGLFGIGVFAALASYLIGPEILGIIYGVSLVEYRFPLTLTVLAGILSGGATILSTILTIMRKMKIQVVNLTATFVLCVILSYFMITTNVSQALYAYFLTMLVEMGLFLISYFILINRK